MGYYFSCLALVYHDDTHRYSLALTICLWSQALFFLQLVRVQVSGSPSVLSAFINFITGVHGYNLFSFTHRTHLKLSIYLPPSIKCATSLLHQTWQGYTLLGFSQNFLAFPITAPIFLDLPITVFTRLFIHPKILLQGAG